MRIDVLERAASTADVTTLGRAARFTRVLSPGQLLEDGRLIRGLLARAEQLGYDVGESVSHDLLLSFEGRERFGNAGEPFPLDLLLLARARALAETELAGSRARRFYVALAEIAVRFIGYEPD